MSLFQSHPNPPLHVLSPEEEAAVNDVTDEDLGRYFTKEKLQAASPFELLRIFNEVRNQKAMIAMGKIMIITF